MRYTKKFLSSLSQPLIGIDEVGRGCLAGPVYAAAVIFKSEKDVKHYQDSKKLTAQQRLELSLSIKSYHTFSIGIATVEEIDQLNILQASFLAMRRALGALSSLEKTVTVLVDGRDKIPNLGEYQQLPIIQGDSKVRLIGAASIVAKVARDLFMTELATQFGNYGFEKHKGYGTAVHRQQIQKHGPTVWHRQTFSGVKEHIRSF